MNTKSASTSAGAAQPAYVSAAAIAADSTIFTKTHPEKSRYRRLLGEIIIIEGSIGVGKTTLGRNIVSYLNDIGVPAIFIEESVNPQFLNLFYKGITGDQNYSFAFQMSMLQNCLNNYDKAQWEAGRHGGQRKVVLIDRAVWGNFAFAALHREEGNITAEEYGVYISELKARGPYEFDKIIYLDVSPQTALKNINSRGRNSENACSLEYLEKLDNSYYAHVYEQIRRGNNKIIVISNEQFVETKKVLELLVQDIEVGGVNPELAPCEKNEVSRRGFQGLTQPL